MKLGYFVFFHFVACVFAQLDFSVYDDVVVVKKNSIPMGIQKCLDEVPELNFKEIKTISYPANIILETNILTHLYDNYWQKYLSETNRNDKIYQYCANKLDSEFLDNMAFMVKIHRQYLKNIHNISKLNGKCRVCDPVSYWFRVKLEQFGGGPLSVDTSFLPIRELSKAVEKKDHAECVKIIESQIPQFNNLIGHFYQTYLKDNFLIYLFVKTDDAWNAWKAREEHDNWRTREEANYSLRA